MIDEKWASVIEFFADLSNRTLEYLPAALGAVVLLAIGWLIARGLRAATVHGLSRLRRLVAGRSLDHELTATGIDGMASQAAGAIVFWLVFLFFLAAAGEVLGLAVITTGLSRLAQYLPNVLGAVLVLLAGIVLANVARSTLDKATTSAGVSYGAALGQAARAVILLVAGVIVLEQLGIDSGLLGVATNVVIASLVGGVALAFALGSRTAVSNLLALHYVTRIYRVGQRVRIDGLEGEIVEFARNGVVVKSAEGRVFVPAREFGEGRSTLLDGPES